VSRRANALNYAYLQHIEDIMGRSCESTFRGKPEIIALGETLSEILDDDTTSDRELVDRFADTIQVSVWFIGIDFEDVPAAYCVD
jgi:hypothetical protein